MDQKAFDPEQIPDLSGRVYLVTGGTSGIGYQTVLHVAAHNAKVYVGARSETTAQESFGKIREIYPNAVLHLLQMDLMDLKSVKLAAENFLKRESTLHVLINNAGIAVTPYKVTTDGFEAQFQGTHYLRACPLLTYLLLPTITKTSLKTKPSAVRVVNISSDGHRFFAPANGINFADINLFSPSISPWKRYGQSKLAGILHIKALNEKFGPGKIEAGEHQESGKIWTASVHPGSVDSALLTESTGFGSLLNYLIPVLRFIGHYITPDQGSWTTLYTATSDKVRREESGEYFVPFGKKGKASQIAGDKKLADTLWEWTEKEFKTRELI